MTDSAVATVAQATATPAYPGEVPLSGVRLRLLQGLWLFLALGDLVTLVVSLPIYYRALFSVCSAPLADCPLFDQIDAGTFPVLQHAGVSLSAYAFYVITLDALTTLSFLVFGTLIIWRRHNTWMGLFTSFLLLDFGCLGVSYVHVSAIPMSSPDPALNTLFAVANQLSFLPSILTYPSLSFFFATFPDGRFVPRWSWALIFLWVANVFVWIAPSHLAIGYWPPLLEAGWLTFVFCGSGCVQLYRFTRVATPIQRQQIKWLLYGFIPLTILPICLTLYMTFVPSLNQPGAFILNTPHSLLLVFTLPLYRFWYLPVAVCIGIALLRYRLYDIDIIVNRTLVYATLTACVIGIYVLIVGYLGAALHVGSNPVISLIAAAVVALLFQPLRDRFQRGANRLMFGDRDTPYAVLARLDGRLAEALPAETALSTIVATVASALKLPYAAITLAAAGTPDASSGTDEQVTSSPPHELAERVAAEHGSPAPIALRLPLAYGAEKVGDLYLAARSGETSFATADERLLKDLAAHAGVVVHAVRLTADLQAARERLITAREEERRRLRRDLHDGLGPQLASLILTLTAAREYLTRDPVAADTLLAELATHVQGAIADVRRLVYELRPPSLDDLGLAGALRDQASRYSHGGLEVWVDAPGALRPLPAAVEVAAYRVCLEALTNVVRHAQAHKCVITLRQGEEHELHIEVSDDGVGMATGATMGVGLRSMRERAEELGGMCVIEPAPSSGTRVRLSLPLPVAEARGGVR